MEARHLILYDGVCGLCDRFNRFVFRRDPRGVFRFASIQSATGRRLLADAGRNPEDLDTFYVVQDYNISSRSLMLRSDASLFVLRVLGGPWRIAVVFRAMPAFLLDWIYDRIAANRYRVFGHSDSCIAPRPEYAERFIDTP